MKNVIGIIGPTASGKSDLAHTLARQNGAVLLSCDSLSVFQEIDIASAKPTPQEREGLSYFGLDLVKPCGRFGVDEFMVEFERAKEACVAQNRPLIIVGGSGFYLKVLLEGLSTLPPIGAAVQAEVDRLLQHLPSAYGELTRRDGPYAARIQPTDRYRIEKGLLIALCTGKSPSEWFGAHPPRPLLKEATLFEVSWPVARLRDRIHQRTQKMLQKGLIDEVAALEVRCPRNAQAMRSIGITEVLDYLDGKLQKEALADLIATHTAQLAKRQRTFNRGQFPALRSLPPEEILPEARAAILTQKGQP